MRFLAWLALGMALCCPGLAAGAAPAPHVSRLVLTGHGLGHGIGLSQWGAEARAAAGQSLTQILAFYYPGTSIQQRPAAAVRVLVAERAILTVGSRGSFTARDAAGRTWARSGLAQLTATRFAGTRVSYPLELEAGAAPLRVGGVAYAGSIRVVRRRGMLLAVDRVALEDYVTSVVSTENPAYWPATALQAQAVAARSYALAHLRTHAPFDLYSDDRSQNYRGLARDFPAAARAAEETAGTVLGYRGRIADAMFSASNGGLTNSGGLPYLVTRPDPFDAAGPAANWGPVSIPEARILAAFPELGSGLESVSATYDAAQRIASVTLVSTSGARSNVSGFTFQQRLGLRSTYFTIAVDAA